MALQGLIPQELRFREAETPQLRIESWSDSARTLHLRGFTRDGLISLDHTTNSDRSIASEDSTIPDLPISLQVSPSTGPVRRGECYVRITLLMGGFPVGRLIAAYLTDGKTLTWPPGVQEGFIEGPGYVHLVSGSNPAAGAECSESVPTNSRWRLIAVYLNLTTDATVATRTINLIIDNGTSIIWKGAAWGSQTASQSPTYSAAQALNPDSSSGSRQQSLPSNNLLFAGYRIRTLTTNLQAGDDYAIPRYLVEEWIEE